MKSSYLTALFFVDYGHLVDNDTDKALEKVNEDEHKLIDFLENEGKTLFINYKNALLQSLDDVQTQAIDRAINFSIHIGMTVNEIILKDK